MYNNVCVYGVDGKWKTVFTQANIHTQRAWTQARIRAQTNTYSYILNNEHVLCRYNNKEEKDSSVKTTYRYSVIKINDNFLAQWKWYKPNQTKPNDLFAAYSNYFARAVWIKKKSWKKFKVVKLCQYYLAIMERITVNIKWSFCTFKTGRCDAEIRFSFSSIFCFAVPVISKCKWWRSIYEILEYHRTKLTTTAATWNHCRCFHHRTPF